MAKIITLDALYEYFSGRGKTVHFNSKDAGRDLFVKADGKMKFEELDNKGLLKVVLQSCHVGKNLNGSSISYEAMQEALPSFYSRPILGYIHEVDGQYEFKSHEMNIDKDGNLVYEEIPVGVITSRDGMIEHDYEKGHDYAVVSGVIWEEYTRAAEILKRDKKASCSVELKLNDLSYDANEKVLVINSFIFTGVTILGKDDYGNDIKPGMDGANIAIEEEVAIPDGESVPTGFSNDNKSEERRTTNMAIQGLPEGNKPEEIDQITNFDGDDAVGGDASDASGNNENSNDPADVDGDGNVQPDLSNQDDNKPEPEPEQTTDGGDGDVQPDSVADPEPQVAEEPDQNAEEPTLTRSAPSADIASSESEQGGEANDDGVKKKLLSIGDATFELTLCEKAWAVSDLVNITYSDEDNDWYFCDVFENTVIMIPWMGSQCYRHGYEESESGVFSLVGEREKVFAEWLNESERDALTMMRSTYAELKKYKEDAEFAKIEAEKDHVFNMFDEQLADNSDYNNLKQNRDKYAAQELEEKCNAIVGRQAMQFAAKEKETTKRDFIPVSVAFSNDTKKDKPYGDLFK